MIRTGYQALFLLLLISLSSILACNNTPTTNNANNNAGTNKNTPTASPSPSAKPTASPTPTPSATPTPTPTPTPAPTATPSTANSSSVINFGLESDIEHPVPIPAEVLALLKKDEETKRCLESSKEKKPDLSKWFSAARIDLTNPKNSANQPDLVVKPENGCLYGANVGPFWIFHYNGKSYDLVYRNFSLGIDITDDLANGFCQIVASSATAVNVITNIYQFDGKKYQQVSSKVEPIDTDDSKQ